MYDVAIIGTGPAGLSAALTLKLHKKSMIWFGSKDLSTKVEKSEQIANFPGVSLVSGQELNRRFKDQIQEAGLEITDKMVLNVASTRRGFMIQADNDIYDARTILLATGAVTAKGYDREEALLGSGVSYCATCDGYLYQGKTIGIICTSKRYEHEIRYLAELAEQVYLFAFYQNCEVSLPNVKAVSMGIAGIRSGEDASGVEHLTGVRLKDGSELPLDGLFILRDAVAPTTMIRGLELDGPHIVVDRNMATSKRGCFAAGDCTGRPYQLTKAVGEGNIAAHAIVEYLE